MEKEKKEQKNKKERKGQGEQWGEVWSCDSVKLVEEEDEG